METQIRDYNFDGDPDSIKFMQLLDYDKFETIRYCVNNKAD